jgi:3-oxoacyl-[acyl-carrier-protein] synthase III
MLGVGETNFSAAQSKTGIELFTEAAMEAIQESNLSSQDI